jgi:hypothetical protein
VINDDEFNLPSTSTPSDSVIEEEEFTPPRMCNGPLRFTAELALTELLVGIGKLEAGGWEKREADGWVFWKVAGWRENAEASGWVFWKRLPGCWENRGWLEKGNPDGWVSCGVPRGSESVSEYGGGAGARMGLGEGLVVCWATPGPPFCLISLVSSGISVILTNKIFVAICNDRSVTEPPSFGAETF